MYESVLLVQNPEMVCIGEKELEEMEDDIRERKKIWSAKDLKNGVAQLKKV